MPEVIRQQGLLQGLLRSRSTLFLVLICAMLLGFDICNAVGIREAVCLVLISLKGRWDCRLPPIPKLRCEILFHLRRTLTERKKDYAPTHYIGTEICSRGRFPPCLSVRTFLPTAEIRSSYSKFRGLAASIMRVDFIYRLLAGKTCNFDLISRFTITLNMTIL
jgi:hypothetical protein